MTPLLRAVLECTRDAAKSAYAWFSGLFGAAGIAKDGFGVSIPLPTWLIWMAAVACIFVAYFKTVWALHKEREKRVGPDIILLAPSLTYSTVWDPPNSLQIITEPKLPHGQEQPLGTRMPVFRIKNVGHSVAKHVALRWRIIEGFSLDQITMHSARMQKFGYQVRGNSTRSQQTRGDLTTAILSTQARSGTETLPYLMVQPEQDSFEFTAVPFSVFEACEIYFAATIPNDKPYQSVVLNCEVEITCKEPTFYTPQRFNVRITARDDGSAMPGEDRLPAEFLASHGLKPKPALKASLKFEVTPI